jgi:hypothetical protein
MTKKFAAVLVVSMFVSGFTARMNAQQHNPPWALIVSMPDVETKDAGSNLLQYIPPPFDPSIYLEVDPSRSLDANTLAIHQQIASTLNGSAFVPQDRLDYYSAYTNSDTDKITGWCVDLRDVQANCDGFLATIQVHPSITSSTKGAQVIILPNYYEQYQISNGQVDYQGFLDPDGSSGQKFGEIGL